MMTSNNFFDPTTAPYINPSTDHRTALITGGNSGVGWYTVLHLYLHGYSVYVAGRTESKVRKAIDEIKEEARKRAEKYSEAEKKERHFGSIDYVYIDLLDLSTVNSAVEEFGKKESALHLLINNAGIMGVPYEVTKDGYEIQYQVNFVSHLLLTLKLMPFLKKISEKGTVVPRIITLTSLGHKLTSYKYYHPSAMLNNKPNFAYTWVRYSVAKLAEIHFMKVLAMMHPDILCVAVHPGVVTGTELYNYWKQLPVVGVFAGGFFNLSSSLMGVSNEEGALASLRTALDPTITPTKDSGKYYVTGGVEEMPSKIALNKENSITTWNWNIEQLKKRNFEFNASTIE